MNLNCVKNLMVLAKKTEPGSSQGCLMTEQGEMNAN